MTTLIIIYAVGVLINALVAASIYDDLKEDKVLEKVRLAALVFFVNRCYGRSQSSCKECTKKAAAAKKTELRRDPEYRRQENEKWMRRYNTNEEFKAKHNAKAAERKRKARAKAKAEATEQVCRNCWLYPCFRGIENMTTNFALTCRKWHLKGDKSNI